MEILGTEVFSSFKDLIQSKTLEKVLPTEYDNGSTDAEAVENVYRKFYPKDKEETYGVLGINLKKLH